ncbi:ankyrin repeat protein [Gregarina niphandrodes]|uniref:Ankyrin repeat protein n=1 Tax=Gregarina niphandrodes TaxID=110365 RepID=A0A023B3N9_GRENI|nr:ankyrin repeat protein [Gregarina niphandrodes]EZG55491.1 ankyrin repeat protein [Gregarina niphandrodes]|eukprot:XP_011131535.1 ankyrin repeat protein [Gregarina niphandrodes]
MPSVSSPCREITKKIITRSLPGAKEILASSTDEEVEACYPIVDILNHTLDPGHEGCSKEKLKYLSQLRVDDGEMAVEKNTEKILLDALLGGAFTGNVEIVDQAVRCGADLTACESSGRNILHYCATGGHHSLLAKVLKKLRKVCKEDTEKFQQCLNKVDSNGWSPLSVAVCRNQVECVNLFLGVEGIDVFHQLVHSCPPSRGYEKTKSSLLHLAAIRGSLPIMRLIAQEIPIDTVDSQNRNPLHYLAAIANPTVGIAVVNNLLSKPIHEFSGQGAAKCEDQNIDPRSAKKDEDELDTDGENKTPTVNSKLTDVVQQVSQDNLPQSAKYFSLTKLDSAYHEAKDSAKSAPFFADSDRHDSQENGTTPLPLQSSPAEKLGAERLGAERPVSGPDGKGATYADLLLQKDNCGRSAVFCAAAYGNTDILVSMLRFLHMTVGPSFSLTRELVVSRDTWSMSAIQVAYLRRQYDVIDRIGSVWSLYRSDAEDAEHMHEALCRVFDIKTHNAAPTLIVKQILNDPETWHNWLKADLTYKEHICYDLIKQVLKPAPQRNASNRLPPKTDSGSDEKLILRSIRACGPDLCYKALMAYIRPGNQALGNSHYAERDFMSCVKTTINEDLPAIEATRMWKYITAESIISKNNRKKSTEQFTEPYSSKNMRGGYVTSRGPPSSHGPASSYAGFGSGYGGGFVTNRGVPMTSRPVSVRAPSQTRSHPAATSRAPASLRESPRPTDGGGRRTDSENGSSSKARNFAVDWDDAHLPSFAAPTQSWRNIKPPEVPKSESSRLR